MKAACDLARLAHSDPPNSVFANSTFFDVDLKQRAATKAISPGRGVDQIWRQPYSPAKLPESVLDSIARIFVNSTIKLCKRPRGSLSATYSCSVRAAAAGERRAGAGWAQGRRRKRDCASNGGVRHPAACRGMARPDHRDRRLWGGTRDCQQLPISPSGRECASQRHRRRKASGARGGIVL